MPLDREVKSKLRDRVSLANKTNADEVIAEVEAARATLDPDDKDYARLTGWIEDVQHVAGGKIIGRTGDPGAQPDGMA
jgi:ABC-type phosphate/phosphonate transport system substrate-binding protein